MWTHKNGSAGELLSTPINNKINASNKKDQNNNDALNDMPDDTRNDELAIKGKNSKSSKSILTNKNNKNIVSSVFKSTTGIGNNNELSS